MSVTVAKRESSKMTNLKLLMPESPHILASEIRVSCLCPTEAPTMFQMLKEQSTKHAVSGLDGIHLPMQEMQDAVGSITGAGRSCKVGTGNPLQYS